MKKTNFDVLIIGSGLAGLSTALKLADDKHIGLVCKTELTESSSHWAQGGVAAAISPEDPISSHINDTKNAGAGLCDEDVTEFVASNSEKALDWLMNLGQYLLFQIGLGPFLKLGDIVLTGISQPTD